VLMHREGQIAPSRRENNAFDHRMSLFWHPLNLWPAE
jgi:hypothetical protein